MAEINDQICCPKRQKWWDMWVHNGQFQDFFRNFILKITKFLFFQALPSKVSQIVGNYLPSHDRKRKEHSCCTEFRGIWHLVDEVQAKWGLFSQVCHQDDSKITKNDTFGLFEIVSAKSSQGKIAWVMRSHKSTALTGEKSK